jgi:hypothetical protein
MFWLMVLAHLIADYPLQPDWMVRAKRRLPGLLLHVGIHFCATALVLGLVGTDFWLPALALAGFHFVIDLGKNLVNRLRPQWVSGPYLIDQVFHYISMWIVYRWMPANPVIQTPPVAYLAIAYLCITYVSFVTERILAHARPAYRELVDRTRWRRILTRALILSGLLLSWSLFANLFAPSIFLQVRSPLPSGAAANYRRTMLLIDIAISLAGFLFLALVTRSGRAW